MTTEKAFDGNPYAGTPLRTIAMLIAAAVMSAASYAAETTLFMRSKSNILWRTSPGTTFDVPVVLPPDATSATLTVTGRGYSRTYSNLSGGSQEVALPAATSDETENVFDLTLTFDDPAATVQTVKLGHVASAATSGDAEAWVRVAGSRRWGAVKDRAVIRIPANAGTLAIDGEPVDDGLDGGAGWFRFDAVAGQSYEVGLGADIATLYGVFPGFLLIYR